jgi:alpha-beta hydrolase superfamily lysophospholipase
MAPRSAGSGYLALPDDAEGPGVLVLHAWWGLTPFFKGVCDRLAEAGYVALAPDLCGGRTVDDPDEAKAMLAEADMDATLDLVRSSVITLRALPATPDAPVGTLGFSMGASWALWLASRTPELVVLRDPERGHVPRHLGLPRPLRRGRLVCYAGPRRPSRPKTTLSRLASTPRWRAGRRRRPTPRPK